MLGLTTNVKSPVHLATTAPQSPQSPSNVHVEHTNRKTGNNSAYRALQERI